MWNFFFFNLFNNEERNNLMFTVGRYLVMGLMAKSQGACIGQIEDSNLQRYGKRRVYQAI
jgi:hypothetical protein